MRSLREIEEARYRLHYAGQLAIPEDLKNKLFAAADELAWALGEDDTEFGKILDWPIFKELPGWKI